MSNNLTHTGIPTAGIFGMENARAWNPVKGCKNERCHLHPVNTGKCWAAQMCNRMAEPWALSEVKYSELNKLFRPNCEDLIKNDLKNFKPTWLESQFEKQFPKKRSCILVGYMTDIAYISREWVQKMIGRIIQDNEERELAGLPLHTFQFLTKDPKMIYTNSMQWPINCQLGFTATNQNEFNERSYYAKIAAYADGFDFRRISYAYLEPLRGPINIKDQRSFDWVIVGGGSEPLKPDWVRSIRDQCQAAGIPFYFKQWSKKYIPCGHSYATPKELFYMRNPQKYAKEMKAAGGQTNWLDNKQWKQFPEVE